MSGVESSLPRLGKIPLGIRMELHGKMPLPLIFEQIEKMDEVRAIYEECEKKRGK